MGVQHLFRTIYEVKITKKNETVPGDGHFLSSVDFYNLPPERNVSGSTVEDTLKIIIVDDDPEARELLSYVLREEEKVAVAGQAGSVDEAVQLLIKVSPDLVFLDIQMSGKDGFHFIEQIHQAGYDPGIIFVTAYEHYAIQAIRNSVFDYILKPINRQELTRAIERFTNRIEKDSKQDLSKLIKALRESGPIKVKLNTRSGYILINPQEVVYCQADGNYTHIQLLNGGRELTTQNLGTIEEILGGNSFFRASRSYLLNLRYLSRVDRKSCSCVLEYSGETCSIKIPSQKIKILEASFS